MRFCLVSTFYPPANFGGDGIQVERLARALADGAHDVTVVHSLEAYRALAGRVPDRAPTPHPGVSVMAIDTGTGKLSPLANYLTGRPLLSGARLADAMSGGFDVVHYHNPSLIGAPGLLGYGDALQLYTAHEHWLVCPTHVLWKYGRRVCERPTCWRCSISYGRPPQPWRSTGMLDRAVAKLDALIVLSRTSASLHDRFASLVPIEQLGNFVPDPGDPASPRARPEGRERPYFLFVGRLESLKGVETLVRAFRRRRSEDLVVVGTGSLERHLRDAARDLPHVRFLGWTEPAELDRLYRNALAVLVPTLGHETFGLTCVEGFAHGTAAIVHDFGALSEMVDGTGAGLGYGTDAELDGALARLAADADLRARLGARARAAYLERWTPAAHLQGYFELIARAAHRRRDDGLAAAATREAAVLRS